ncbi:MBL fold metallo-hydrolase [Mycoplasmatota bacterium]|nr:MBL fold metallo-hydrolase [Mycoplasmatota bacterium]
MFKLKTIKNQKMDMNSYLLIKKKHVILIDPGFNGHEILNVIEENHYTIEAILLTHGHYDHIRDIKLIYQNADYPIYIHSNDYKSLYDPNMNYSKAFNQNFILDKDMVVKKLNDETSINLLNENINVIHTPGHTFGSVMFEYNKYIFSGDTIFYDSIGRTDLFSGNFNAIRRSINMIKDKISNNKIILPGHGQSGSFEEIKKINRFFQ